MIISSGEGRAAFAFMAVVEADPERSRGGRPPVLTQGDAGQMLAHLYADLKTMLPGLRKCRLAAGGGLYDQCQLLRPGWPVFSALSGLLSSSASDGASTPLTAVGREDNGLMNPALAPDPGLLPGLLQLVPLVMDGPEDVVNTLAEEMEHRFMAEGQVSAHTASWLEAAFAIGIAHARFMTLTDLLAMLRLQLENFGYLPLWELIDAAVNGSQRPLEVTTTSAARYRWDGEVVSVLFETFDYWANNGAGQDVDDEGGRLFSAYAEWHAELRRYVSTLAAHHVPLRYELPEGAHGRLEDRIMLEIVPGDPAEGEFASITEHDAPELGVVAITARTADSLFHFYPLAPGGLNDIHDALQAMELEGEGMAFPGRIEIDGENRRLRAARF